MINLRPELDLPVVSSPQLWAVSGNAEECVTLLFKAALTTFLPPALKKLFSKRNIVWSSCSIAESKGSRGGFGVSAEHFFELCVKTRLMTHHFEAYFYQHIFSELHTSPKQHFLCPTVTLLPDVDELSAPYPCTLSDTNINVVLTELH